MKPSISEMAADTAIEHASAFPYCLLGPEGNDLLSEQKTPRDRLIRIQTLLAQWMRMENITVLLGAGCSVSGSLGGKTLGQLEDEVLSVLGARYVGEDDSTKKAIVEQRRQDKSQKAAENFEAWLSYLSNAAYLLAKSRSPIAGLQWKSDNSSISLDKKTADDLLRDIERVIFAACALVLPSIDGSEAPVGHHAFFAKLIARDPTLGRAHVFTLNYDSLIEQALDQLGILYFDGFSGRADAKFDSSVYGLDVYYPGEVSAGRVSRYDKFLHLYKLHGSIHWTFSDDGTVRAAHQPLQPYRAWRQLDEQGRANRLDDLFTEARAPSLAIMPTANKFTQTLDIPFAHLFRSFYQRLHTPQTFFIVIGYGFGDEHVNQIIDAAMTNPSLILLVVDPAPSAAVRAKLRRYQGVGERVFLLCPQTEAAPDHSTFDDFALRLMPQTQWLEDFIKLRRYEKAVGATVEPSEGGAPTAADD